MTGTPAYERVATVERVAIAGLAAELAATDGREPANLRDAILAVVHRPQLRIVIEQPGIDGARFTYLFATPSFGVLGRLVGEQFELEACEPALLPLELARAVGLRPTDGGRRAPVAVAADGLESLLHAWFPDGWRPWRADAAWADAAGTIHPATLVVVDGGTRGYTLVESEAGATDDEPGDGSTRLTPIGSGDLWRRLLGCFPYGSAAGPGLGARARPGRGREAAPRPRRGG
ncbi:MAG: hypothetical protein U0V73_16075 [Acidimicrobiia bacterium]